MQIITDKIRKYYVGPEQDFTFKNALNLKIPKIERTDIYIHIPFCRNLCPYCPYNKIPYDDDTAKQYVKALKKEMDLYSQHLGNIEIGSIYLGGGTPTNVISELSGIIEKIKENFTLKGDICIETNPNDINYENISKLTDCGVTLISLGVQSFNKKYLDLIGRKYDDKIIYKAIEKIRGEFSSFNLDLMFALPGQTMNGLKDDIEKGIECGADQITAYPLFTFPYSSVGEYMKLKKVKMPSIPVRRSMYKRFNEICSNAGFSRVSVWSYKMGEKPRYSSVTRDHYIGFGCGSASHTGDMFYINTFSVPEYIKKCEKEEFPISVKMDMTKKMQDYFWLYWRLYDTIIDMDKFKQMFQNDRKAENLLKMIKDMKMGSFKDNAFILNEKGSFWVHLLQNYFSLNYINKIWLSSRKTPWPDQIEI